MAMFLWLVWFSPCRLPFSPFTSSELPKMIVAYCILLLFLLLTVCLCWIWRTAVLDHSASCRSEGCNRTNSDANFRGWIGVVKHDDEKAKLMKRASLSYTPACWKYQCCQNTHLRPSQQRLHQSLVHALLKEVEHACAPGPGKPAMKLWQKKGLVIVILYVIRLSDGWCLSLQYCDTSII